VKTPTLKDLPVKDRQRSDFLQACIESAGCFKPPREAQREVEALEQRLLSETSMPGVKSAGEPTMPADDPLDWST
jgi:hypothetical protein